MTSWTLDNTTFHYWTLNETGEVIWGYPKHGDEVIIDDRFKYIFKGPKKESNFTSDWNGLTTENHLGSIHTSPAIIEQFNQAIDEYIENGNHGIATINGTYTQTNETESIDNVRITVEVYSEENTSNDEISTYMREAQQMMDNGR